MAFGMQIFLLQLLIVLCNKYASATSACAARSAYGGKPCPYVPAPPGERPPCAKNGYTFCEYPQHYPTDLVMNLVEKWKYDHGTLLLNESPKDYYYKTTETYGPPPQNNQPTYPYPNPVYGPPAIVPITNNHQQPGHQPGQQQLAGGGFQHPGPHSFIQPPPENQTHFQQHYSPLDAYKNKFAFFQNNYQSPRTSTRQYLPPASDYVPQYQPNDWSKWNDQKYYMRKKRALVKRWLNNELNATNTMLLGDMAEGPRRKRQIAQQDTEQETLCETFSQFIMPRAAMNNRGDWMYVVNMAENDGKYSQLVRSETCRAKKCKNLCSIPDGFSSRCEQRYVQKRLVAIEPGGTNLYTDVFWFPSCCVCAISRTNVDT